MAMLFTMTNDIKISHHALERFAARVLDVRLDRSNTKDVERIIRQYMPTTIPAVEYIKFTTKGVTFVVRNKVVTTIMVGGKNG